MSIYSALGFEEPTIAYTALHQVRKGLNPDVYRQTMKDFHTLLREESKKVNEAWEAFRKDSAGRAIQSARSHLLQYLSTPLKSDTDEIQRILRERIEEYSTASVSQKPLGMIQTSEGRIIDTLGKPLTKTHVASGRRYLAELGFSGGRPRRDIYESVFVVQGGQNLDVIEHIVRDRIGIYTPVHGKHIREFDSYSYAAHNLVILLGELESKAAGFETALHCSKGGVKYDVFRSGLKELLEEIQREHEISHASLWQRKLGLGSGREFVLRLQGKDQGTLLHALAELQRGSDKPFLKQALKGGHILCKEFLPE